MADTQARFPEVLLEGVVADFRRITGDLKAHQVVVGDTVYPQPCVYLTTHLVEMWAAGWRDADFDTLAAVSGASALFAYEPREFMPKYANLSIGMDQRIASATGFGYEWVPFEGVEGAWAVVRASVDSGLPLKGWHWENLLIGGYRDAATEEDRRIFVMSDGPGTSAEWWAWQEFGEWVREWSHGQLGRHTRRVRKTAARKVALRVIRDLAEWSEKPPRACREGYPKATFGLAGIEAYAADCANTDAYADWAACHDINPQWTIRNSTAVYLERVAAAGTFGRKVSAHLLAAAEHYRASFACWEEFYAQLGHQAPENAGKMRDRRAAGAAAAREWLEHERAALAELRDALSLLEG